MKEQAQLLAVSCAEEMCMKQVKSVQLDLEAAMPLKSPHLNLQWHRHVATTHLRQSRQVYTSWNGFKQVCQEFVQLRIQKPPC